MNDDVVVVGREKTPEQIAGTERVRYVLPGGGKRIRFTRDGREVVIGGESLRNALGARRIQKPNIPGDVIFNGAEIVVYTADAIREWLNRPGAKDLGPMALVVGEEPVPMAFCKTVAEQRSDAAVEQHIYETNLATSSGR